MNTQLNIKLTSDKSVIGLTYRPTEFQIGYGGTRDIKAILKMGTSDTKLHKSLSSLYNIISTEKNIYDYLVSTGKSDINEKLKHNTLTVVKLLNSIPFAKLSEITTLLSNSFIKEPDFYEFSIGMLDFVGQNIQSGLETDFVKINRRINSGWGAHVSVETTEGYSYQTRTSTFSFKDDYKFNLSELDSSIPITNYISSLFVDSIRPYADIFMEKLIPDVFRSIHLSDISSTNINDRLGQLAWELFTPTKMQRYPENAEIYSKFNELVSFFIENISHNPLYSLPYTTPTRAITVSTTSSIESSKPKLNFAHFDTYQNKYYNQWINREKNGVEHPKMMTIIEIKTLIHRVKRYFEVIKIGEVVFDNVLSKKETYTKFDDIVLDISESVYTYFDKVCELYAIESEM
jgi:hypothetical protein